MKQIKSEIEQVDFAGLMMGLISEAVWLKDTKGAYLGCNAAFENLFEVKESQIIGLTDSDFLAIKHAEIFSMTDQLIISEGQKSVYEEIVFPIATGDPLILESKKSPIISERTGKLIGLLGVAKDITQQRKNEQNTEFQENFFRSIFNMQFQFTAILSSEGYVLEINDLPLKVQNVKREDYIGKKFWSTPAWVNLPEWKGIWQLRLQQAAEQDEPILTEDVFQVQDGSIRYANASTTAMRDVRGNLAGFVVQATDTTDLKTSEQAIRQSAEKYRALYEQIPQGVVQHDSTGKIIGANPAAESILGFSLEFLLDGFATPNNWNAIHEDGSAYLPHEHPIMKALRDGKPYKNAIIGGFNPESQTYKWILLDAIPQFHPNETKPYGVFSSFSDISERKQSEERLRLSASIFENTQEGIMVTDAHGSILEINSAFTDITGYQREEVIGHNPRLLKSGHHDICFYENMWESLKTSGSWSGETWNKNKDNVIYPVWQNIFTVANPNDQLINYVSVFADISRLKQSQQELDHLAYHDALTGLPNRLLLKERLNQAILHASRHNNQFTVIFLDLDNFKNINDSLGHPQGDILLQTVSSYLLQTVRQEDTVARIGGDEFVLLLEGLSNIDKVAVIAKKILLALQQPVVLAGRSLNVSASLGICLYPQDGETADELLRNADAAMYRAKDEGRNNYQFYSRDLTDNALMRIRLENDLRQALNKNELQLDFQPQIDLKSQKLTGVEALIRWQHPEFGMVKPKKFVSIAENSGLIIPMGNWVLEKACFQATAWLENGMNIGRIAVNVAGLQLQRGDLVKQVKSALLKSKLPASKLELEITEGFIMQRTDSSISQLQTLREMGVALAIDDFGTGYSSLSYLKQLPIHKLKIDQSFVRDITKDTDDKAISKTIVALGESLGMSVIAEGVETEAQANYLRDGGCHQAQGFLYSKPISATEFEKYYFANFL